MYEAGWRRRWSGVQRVQTVALAGLVATGTKASSQPERTNQVTSSELQEHVTRVASGEGSSALAAYLYQFTTASLSLTAAVYAVSSPGPNDPYTPWPRGTSGF